MRSPYTPATLAAEWNCSEHHVRNLINRGELRAFRLGHKLFRIPAEAVEEFVQCRMTTQSESSKVNASSSTETVQENGAVTVLAPLTRARLDALRRRSMPSEPAQKERK
jgi:excisionase family DNA binding protein